MSDHILLPLCLLASLAVVVPLAVWVDRWVNRSLDRHIDTALFPGLPRSENPSNCVVQTQQVKR